jgi:hypothetical protein
MSDTLENTVQNIPDFIQKADDVSGRPSEGEGTPQNNRLNETTEMFLPDDSYSKLELPENLKGQEENFASFKKLAAELNIPAETAEKLIQWESAATEQGQKIAEGDRADILQKWTEKTKEMFGPSYQREVLRALDAAERFGGGELRALLDVTGLGSHPVIVKTFHKISTQISEDVSVSGKSRNSTDKTFAEALYGKAF